MSEACEAHLAYLGAIADGELDLVPDETRRHVGLCDSCAAEVGSYRLLNQRIRESATGRSPGWFARLARQERAASGRPRRWRRPRRWTAIAAVVALGGGA